MKGTRIYLSGFMTSGKSTIGPILANTLGLSFFDLDKVIEEKERKTIVEIFEQNGEAYFRELETGVLREIIKHENIVLSLGGGTLAKQENFDMLKTSGVVVYLKVSVPTLYKRLKNKIDRPIFRDLVLGENSEDEFLKRIKDLLDKRQEFFEKADIIFTTDGSPIGITVDKLAKKIMKSLNEES